MSEQYFHLTIGPVQAFVAQARRTRDFWAGSFVLSFLSSVAMSAVRQQGGEIQFPVPDDNYLSWLEGTNKPNAPKPLQGSVPNRFKALEVLVDQDFQPELVVSAIDKAWQGLAELIWESDLAPVAEKSSIQRQIWERQINHFWDISWCLTKDRDVSNLLDRRKNWRSHVPADEPGVKCSLMEGYQELSGAERPGDGVREFWRHVRAQSTSLARDLRDDEHLCAIALVKRRFAHYFDQFEMTLPAAAGKASKPIMGWQVPKSVPSIAYLAAAPWLAASIRIAVENPQALITIKTLQKDLQRLDAPWESSALKCIDDACTEADRTGWRWSQVNGQYLFAPAVHQLVKEARRSDSLLNDDVEYLERVQKHLRALKQQTELAEPSPFFAVLLMDGDSLGAQMSNPAKQKGISTALNTFNQGVPPIVQAHNGFLVYAGGDDVLALLPQPDAIACANKLQQHYARCFDEQNAANPGLDIFTSLSGAIEYSHYKAPLTRVLEDAHQLLDDVAKDQTGRNSLAIRAWKPGGLFAQWSAPWSVVDSLSAAAEQVAAHLKGDLSRSFFFKLEALIEQLGLEGSHQFDEQTIRSLVRAAWVHTGTSLESLPKEMDLILLEACRTVTRKVDKNEWGVEHKTNQFSPGALRLLQFLATENQMFIKPALSAVTEVKLNDHYHA